MPTKLEKKGRTRGLDVVDGVVGPGDLACRDIGPAGAIGRPVGNPRHVGLLLVVTQLLSQHALFFVTEPDCSSGMAASHDVSMVYLS